MIPNPSQPIKQQATRLHGRQERVLLVYDRLQVLPADLAALRIKISVATEVLLLQGYAKK